MAKILLVGCGYWGKNWYNTILSSKYTLVGVVDPNPVLKVDVPLYNTVDDVDVEYTHAIVATNAESHLIIRNQLKCLDKNILIEKPCGLAQDRLSLNHCFPGYVFLSSPQFSYIKSILDSRELGDIIYTRFERASMGPRIRTDVSIIEDYAIHDLYLYQALFNHTEINILAKTLLKSFENSPTMEDTLFLTIKHKYHVTSFFSSWRHPVKTRKIEIIGKNGAISWIDDIIYLYSSKYNKITGVDSYRNIGYELVDLPTKKITFEQSRSNLHLQLSDFVLGVDRSIILNNTNNLINLIYDAK